MVCWDIAAARQVYHITYALKIYINVIQKKCPCFARPNDTSYMCKQLENTI